MNSTIQSDRDQLAPDIWDSLVASAPDGHFMQTSGWATAQKLSGWETHAVSFTNGTRLCALALLLSRGVPGFGRVFTAPRGPVFLDSAPSVVNGVISELKRYVRKNGGIFCRLDPYLLDGSEDAVSLATASEASHLARTWSYWNAPKYVMWLDLTRAEDALLSAMDRNCQRDIKAGYKKNVDYREGTDEELDEFFRLLVATSNSKGIAHHNEEYYRNLVASLRASCKVGIYFATYEGRAISTVMSIALGTRAWLMYAGSDREYYKLRVNRNVQWEMIKWAKQHGCTRYDFRGSATGDPPLSTDPGYGVYEFKKSFGSNFTKLAGYFDVVASPLRYRMVRVVEESVLPRAYDLKVRVSAFRTRASSRDKRAQQQETGSPSQNSNQ